MTYPPVRLSLAGLLGLFFFKVNGSELNTSRYADTPSYTLGLAISVVWSTFGQVQAWDHWIDNTALRAAYLVEADLEF